MIALHVYMYMQGSGWTALFFAAKAGKSDVCRELVCKGAVTETSSVSLITRTSLKMSVNSSSQIPLCM